MSIKTTSKKPKNKWHFLMGRGMHPAIVMDLVRRGHTAIFGKILNLPFNIYFMKRYEGSTYFLTREYEKVLRYFKIKLKKNPKELYQFIDFFSRKNKDLISFLKKIDQKEIKNLSDKEIKQILNKFFAEYSQLCIHFYLPFFVEDVITPELKKFILPKLKKLDKESELEEYIFRLTQDTKASDVNQEKIELLKIVQQISKNKKLKNFFKKENISYIKKAILRYPISRKILAHQQKYFGAHTYLFNVREYTLKDIILNIKEYIKGNPEKLLKEIIKGQQKLRSAQNKIIKELKLTKRERKILKLAQTYVHFRNVRITQMGNFQCLIKNILEEWAKRQNLTYNEIIYLTSNEILKKKFDKKELKKRINGYIYLLENGRQHIITGREKEEFVRRENRGKKKEKIKTIKGLPVFPGRVRGKVKKATPYTFSQLKKGDVLVCSMTVVEAAPYLSKCKAIVTDEGGITCHAAVVSRELKIPCIVGTKIATRVLKDGDMVEVDAGRGIVRIIK